MRDRDMGDFGRSVVLIATPRHQQSATLSLPSSVMNLRRLISDIAFER